MYCPQSSHSCLRARADADAAVSVRSRATSQSSNLEKKGKKEQVQKVKETLSRSAAGLRASPVTCKKEEGGTKCA